MAYKPNGAGPGSYRVAGTYTGADDAVAKLALIAKLLRSGAELAALKGKGIYFVEPAVVGAAV